MILMEKTYKQRRRMDMERFKKFLRDEEGLETVEYAIVAGLLVLGTVVAIQAVGGQISGVFNTLLGFLGGGA
jgi:Flp pilus assembly pilin Flp